jgi:hypothetical protein
MHAFFSILTSTWMPNIIGLLRIDRKARPVTAAAASHPREFSVEGSKFFWILLSAPLHRSCLPARSRGGWCRQLQRAPQLQSRGSISATPPSGDASLAARKRKEGDSMGAWCVCVCRCLRLIVLRQSSRGSGPRATPCAVRRQYRARCVDARLERQREANEKCLKMLPVLLGGVVLLVLLGYYFSLPATETAGEPAADSEP